MDFINSYMNISQEAGREAGRDAGWEYQPGRVPDCVFLSGDWFCPACGDHQFAKNKECRMCNAPRTEEGKAKGKKGKKGGKKGDKEKEKGGGKGKAEVRNGLEDYEEDSDQLDSRSASRNRSEEKQWNNFTWDLNEWGEREEKLMELPNSWMGMRTYKDIMKRAKRFAGLYGGARKKEVSLLVCPGCYQQVGGGTQSQSDAEQSFWNHVTTRSANEAAPSVPDQKRKHLKPEMFEQVRATCCEELFREEREERRGGGTHLGRSSETRDRSRPRIVRVWGSATDRHVVRGSRKLKKKASKK